MKKPVIAIVCDFDDTLGIDTIGFLLSTTNIPLDKFWQETKDMVRNDGWDPPLAYMHQLLECSKRGEVDISKKALNNWGKKLPLFPGLPKAFAELHDYVKNSEMIKEAQIELEFYIISGGLEEMILGSSLSKYVNGVFGCSFAYDKEGKPYAVKTAVTFTEKTRYLYGINKGIDTKELRTHPYKIDTVVEDKNRRIPFKQMIYIGDGPSDIPSLSAISQHGGTGIGVVSPHKTFRKGYELAKGKRITVGPYTANFKSGSDMRKVLEETILRIGLEIIEGKRRSSEKTRKG